MKIWANDLKEGDKIWICDWSGPVQLVVVGPDHSREFAMPRWELSDGRKIFVNQHVFTTEEEAIDNFLPKLRKQLEILEERFALLAEEIDVCKKQLARYEKCLN